MLYFDTPLNRLLRTAPADNSKLTKLTHDDITLCLGIRISSITPWILDRLKFLLQYYDPAPQFLIVDLGSEPEYAAQIEQVCHRFGAQYFYVEDRDTFSPSKARNIAGRLATTPLLLFSDVDCVFERSIFSRLTQLANDLNMANEIRKVLFMPSWHVGKEASAEFEALGDLERKQAFLQTLSFFGMHTEFKGLFEFVAPYSNVFLIHRDFFDMSGGYCDEFRGHGSEDFEFLIRLGLLSGHIPEPEKLSQDFYGPLKDSFFTERSYEGFRRYLEILTMPCENMGLRTFHIWHDKPADKGYWTAQNDWKRERFNEVLGRYEQERHKILEVDFHPREKKALCLFNDEKGWGYFLPLRLYGYRLQVFTGTMEKGLADILLAVEKNEFDRVFIFNPYMKSHARFRGIVELARKVGVPLTVIERGGLPGSLYYADEVAYGDEDYRKLSEITDSHELISEESSRFMVEELRKGAYFLEHQDTFQETWKAHTLLRHMEKTKIFIPLQLNDDMAVTFFTEGYASYQDFFNEINQVAESFPNVMFVVKRHPLSKEEIEITAENIFITSPGDNIHALIEICSATVVYNSGVGLLSVLHNKPTFAVGNAYYVAEDRFANHAASLSDAVRMLQTEHYHTASDVQILTFADWLMNCKYSWFSAASIIREFESRKAHAYDNIIVERMVLDGERKNCGTNSASYRFSHKSYLGWKAATSPIAFKQSIMGENTVSEQKVKLSKDEMKHAVIGKTTSLNRRKVFVNRLLCLFLSEKKAKKLARDPKRFFEDSRSGTMQWLGRYYVSS